MARKAGVLISGVDTLIINAKRVQKQIKPYMDNVEPEAIPTEPGVQEHVLGLLESWLDIAKQTGKPFVTSWSHEKITLKMFPHGTPTHRWLLKNGLVDVMIGPYLNNNALVRVRFSSEYLWKYGVDVALVNTHAFLMASLEEYLQVQPAEVHLCADVVGLEIPRHYERVFVSRAVIDRPVKESHLDQPVYRHHKIETLQFGGHGSAISASIYNKPNEIEKKSPEKKWFYSLWKKRGEWDGDSPVWRIECRLKRKALHEMDIEDAYDAIEKIPAIWAYCTGHVDGKDGWLRMVLPNAHDSNRWRWNTSGIWLEVQKAFACDWRGYEDMDDVQRERKREINLDRAEKAIAGYATTYAAWLQQELGPDDDVSIVLQRLYEKMQEHWRRNGVDFQMLRHKKEYIYNLQ